MYNTAPILVILLGLGTLITSNVNVYAEEQRTPASGVEPTYQPSAQQIQVAPGTTLIPTLTAPTFWDKWGKLRVNVEAQSHFYSVDNTKFLPSSDKYDMNSTPYFWYLVKFGYQKGLNEINLSIVEPLTLRIRYKFIGILLYC